MEITSKKIITLVKVEITLTEFWETLQNLLDDYRNSGSCKQRLLNELSDYHKEVMTAFCNTYNSVSLEVAQDNFENYVVSDIANIVVGEIAKNNGYEVEHYGIYNKYTKLITATFKMNGNHIK